MSCDVNVHFSFRPFAGKIALSSKTTGQCSHLVHFGSCHYVIKYRVRDVNYHCLRVFRRRAKRIGKHSPGFSMFRTRVHGCSDAELCCVPIQSTVGVIFLFGNWYKPWQTGCQRGRKVQSYWWSRMESNNFNLIELLHQFSPSDILHLVETITYPRIMLSKKWITNNGLCNKYLLWTQTIQKWCEMESTFGLRYLRVLVPGNLLGVLLCICVMV